MDRDGDSVLPKVEANHPAQSARTAMISMGPMGLLDKRGGAAPPRVLRYSRSVDVPRGRGRNNPA